MTHATNTPPQVVYLGPDPLERARQECVAAADVLRSYGAIVLSAEALNSGKASGAILDINGASQDHVDLASAYAADKGKLLVLRTAYGSSAEESRTVDQLRDLGARTLAYSTPSIGSVMIAVFLEAHLGYRVPLQTEHPE